MNGSAELIGTALGSYQIEGLLGRGGMAIVYRARDRRLGRLVALKVLSAAAAAQPGFVGRFQQEARLIASLRHPNIVQIYDLGEQGGHWYMVQELLAGPTLGEQLSAAAAQGAPLPREQVLDITRQLAAALDVAHAAGVVHRDVKPANAIWNGAGALVLTDFGIAKNTQLAAGHTATGVVIGTPSHISPEQAQGRPPTASSDIYSLGVVLYQLLAGRVPFSDASPLGAVIGHLQDAPPPLRPLRPDLPPAAEQVVLRALAKDPAARFRSAGALAQALAQSWPAGAAAPERLAAAHERATEIAPAPRRASAAPAPAPPRQASAAPRQARAAIPAPATPARRGSGAWLLIGGLLLALLIAGLTLARGAALPPGPPLGPAATPTELAAGAPAEAPAPTEAPPTPAADAPAPEPSPMPEPTAAPPPTQAPEPTIAPTAEPSPTPEPTAAPPPTQAPEPTAAPALDPSVGRLRELLLAGQADGRAGPDGDRLIADLDQASQALASGDAKRATDRLRDLQKRIAAAQRADKIDARFASQALDGVAAVARSYGLKLPPAKGAGED